MVDFKIVIADSKTGKCVQREIKGAEADALVGLKISDKVKGELIGLAGYELEITGGSDYCGFPMRKDVPGQARKMVLAVEGIGIKKKDKGVKQRKRMAPQTITTRTAQINLKTLTYGKEKIFDVKQEKKEEKAEGGDKEAQPEEKKEEKKKEKKEEVKEAPKKEAKPQPEKKEEAKPEEKKE